MSTTTYKMCIYDLSWQQITFICVYLADIFTQSELHSIKGMHYQFAFPESGPTALAY